MPRTEAEAIVARGADVVPYLIDALRSDDIDIVSTAMLLLGAIGDESAIGPILDRYIELDTLDEVYQVHDHAQPALMHFGPAVVPFIRPRLMRLADDPNVRTPGLMHVLGDLLEFVPEARPAAIELTLEVLRGFASPHLRGEAASILIWVDYRPAAREIDEARRAGRLAGTFTDQEFEGWLGEDETGPRTLPTVSPLDLFPPPHRAAFRAFRNHFDEVCRKRRGLSHLQFMEDLESLTAPRPVNRPSAGRNDACPCGSGKKYKKCCLDADQAQARPHPALAHIPYLRWTQHGYAMLPSQQIAQLPEAAVVDHLEILRMSGPEVRRRMERETDDYALWACALRLSQLEDWKGFSEIATLVAASDMAHPAIDNTNVEAHALFDMDAMEPDKAISLALRFGRLTAAWNLAESATGDAVVEGFLRVWNAWPRVLWTALALAESAEARAALPHLERALAMAERGENEGHPGPLGVDADAAMRAPCPIEVLRDYVEEYGETARTWAQIDATIARMKANPLSPRLEHELLKWRHDLVLTRLKMLEEDTGYDELEALEQRAGALVDEVLEEGSKGDAPVRTVVVARQELENGLSRALVLGDESTIPAALAALQELAAEMTPLGCRLLTTRWGRWQAAIAELDLLSDDGLDELLELVLEEAQLFPARFDASGLLRAAPLEVRKSLRESEEDDAPLPPPEPVAETGMSVADYVRRVLLRLVRMHKIGAAHTDGGHFLRGVPRSLRGDLKRIYDVLVLERYIRVKPTVTSDHISLEPDRLPVVLDWINDGIRPPGRFGELLDEYASSPA